MQPFGNTTVQQIADHLAPYAKWLARLKGGSLNLCNILVISDEDYSRSVQAAEQLGSLQFRARTKEVPGVAQPKAPADPPLKAAAGG